MRRMLDFCLNETLNDDRSFKLMDEDTVGSSFMIPVHLLDESRKALRRLRHIERERG